MSEGSSWDCGVLAGPIGKITPFLPHYHRHPNKFVRYYKRPFVDRSGKYTGVETMAVYIDKNGKEREEQHCIKWDDM